MTDVDRSSSLIGPRYLDHRQLFGLIAHTLVISITLVPSPARFRLLNKYLPQVNLSPTLEMGMTSIGEHRSWS